MDWRTCFYERPRCARCSEVLSGQILVHPDGTETHWIFCPPLEPGGPETLTMRSRMLGAETRI